VLATALAFLAALAVMLVAFVIALVTGKHKGVDVAWGLGFAAVALTGLVTSTGSGLAWLVTALTVVWGVRLAAHIANRARRDPADDPRYVQLLAKAKGNPQWYAFRSVYLLQAVSVWFVSLPVQLAQRHGGLSWWAVLGVALWLLGFVFETAGDAQLAAFRADPASKGRVLDTGLWRYTRHPNYFGDACVWWGIWLVVADVWPGVLTILSPIAMTFFLLFATGAKLLEKTMMKREGYPEYVERTSMFFPLPPKKR